MKKQIIRLSENDLHNIIENVIKRVITEEKESVQFDFINDILNPLYISDCTVIFDYYTYDEKEIEIIGESGIKYSVTVFVNGEYTDVVKSNDYYVPDEYSNTEEEISEVDISYYNDEKKSWVVLPKEISEDKRIKDFLMEHIDFDWSNYDPNYDNFYEE